MPSQYRLLTQSGEALKDPVPLIRKRRGLSPGGRFPPSFVYRVIIITTLASPDAPVIVTPTHGGEDKSLMVVLQSAGCQEHCHQSAGRSSEHPYETVLITGGY